MDATGYASLHIGDSHTLEKTITEEMVQSFADLSGDYNPVHMNEEYCREHGLESRIVHGMLLMSFLSALIGMYLPGEGAVWLSQSIDFLLPARLGDTVRITGKIIGKEKGTFLAMDILEIKVNIKNQHGNIIARGTAKVAVK